MIDITVPFLLVVIGMLVLFLASARKELVDLRKKDQAEWRKRIDHDLRDPD